MKSVNRKFAEILQKLGYSGDYEVYVDTDDFYLSRHSSGLYDWMIPAPRLDDAFYWIRDTYGIYMDIFSVELKESKGVGYNIDLFEKTLDGFKEFGFASGETYEEALEEALEMSFKKIGIII